MSQSEKRIADVQGKFAKAIIDGTPRDDVGWTAGRILLSNRRLILASGDQKQTHPLSSIDEVGGRFDVNQEIARNSRYVSLRIGRDVVLVSTPDADTFEHDVFSALLDDQIILIRHPAVKGGVMQDTGWEKARLKIGDEEVNIATEGASFVEVRLDDISNVNREAREVHGQERKVVEVEHLSDDASVETFLSGQDRHCSFLSTLLRRGEQQAEMDLDLDSEDMEVIMALYSGVSPFEIPEFVGQDPGEVQETFEFLVEREVLEEVRKRSEVVLTTRGRKLARSGVGNKEG